MSRAELGLAQPQNNRLSGFAQVTVLDCPDAAKAQGRPLAPAPLRATGVRLRCAQRSRRCRVAEAEARRADERREAETYASPPLPSLSTSPVALHLAIKQCTVTLSLLTLNPEP